MSHSIGAKLSGLRHKEYITDAEYHRVKDALRIQSNLKQLREEVSNMQTYILYDGDTKKVEFVKVLDIIDKYLGDNE